jgi:hypothetical protein
MLTRAPSSGLHQSSKNPPLRRLGVFTPKVAELEILHRSKMAGMYDPNERVQAEAEYRHELVRLNEDLERKIGKIRGNSG